MNNNEFRTLTSQEITTASGGFFQIPAMAVVIGVGVAASAAAAGGIGYLIYNTRRSRRYRRRY